MPGKEIAPFILPLAMAAAPAPATKKRPITDPVAARIALLTAQANPPPESTEAMGDVYSAVEECAKKVRQAVEKKAKKNDKGRLIHALDLLLQARDTACASLILPYAEEDAPAESV